MVVLSLIRLVLLPLLVLLQLVLACPLVWKEPQARLRMGEPHLVQQVNCAMGACTVKHTRLMPLALFPPNILILILAAK